MKNDNLRENNRIRVLKNYFYLSIFEIFVHEDREGVFFLNLNKFYVNQLLIWAKINEKHVKNRKISLRRLWV